MIQYRIFRLTKPIFDRLSPVDRSLSSQRWPIPLLDRRFGNPTPG
jgi:hypothetical protein